MQTSFLRLVIILLTWCMVEAVPAQAAVRGKYELGLFPETRECAERASLNCNSGLSQERSRAFIQDTAQAKAAPLTKKELSELVAAHLPNQRIVELITQRGLDFQVDDAYVAAMRKAGANNLVIDALREASVKTAEVAMGTVPNAQVFLDGNLQGQANAQGELKFSAPVGTHALKVSLAGKQDFEQSLTVVAGQPNRVVAPLADLAGSIRVKGPAGAAVALDGSSRGTVDASGELLLTGISAGAHSLRVTAPGKVDGSLTLSVTAGAETSEPVSLADAVRVNTQDQLKYIWIPAGNFIMGCSAGDSDCADPEKPAHPVTLARPFWIGQTDVTVGAYKHYVDVAKFKMPAQSPKVDKGWKRDNFPIVDVTWDEASRYCAWAGGRLPTEAEWEYAARGGSPLARYGDLTAIAWSKDNAGNQTHAVASKMANAYGLYDMLGNVWQWVNDWYDPNYYKNGPRQDSPGPATGTERVLRGGSWIVDPKLLRVSDRYSIRPDARSDYFGFRCVWEPKIP